MGKERHRYKRPPEELRAPLAFNRSPRYDRILYHVWQHRFVTTASLGLFLACDRLSGIELSKGNALKTPALVSLKQIQEAVNALWQNEYLEKWFVRDPLNPWNQTEQESLALTLKGATRIAQLHGLLLDEVKFPHLPDTGKAHKGAPSSALNTLQHQLLITETLGSLALACVLSDRYQLVCAVSDKMIELQSTKKVCPDGFVVVKDTQTNLRHNFFFEIDRSTEKTTTFKQKVLNYYNLPQSQNTAGKEYYSCLPELYDRFHIHQGEAVKLPWMKNIRVLTVCRTDARAKNLAKLVRETVRDGTGSQMFYMTDIARLSPIHKIVGKPTQILEEHTKQAFEPIWHSGLTKNTERVAIP